MTCLAMRSECACPHFGRYLACANGAFAESEAITPSEANGARHAFAIYVHIIAKGVATTSLYSSCESSQLSRLGPDLRRLMWKEVLASLDLYL